MDLPAQKVLYLDLAPPGKRFEMRYAADPPVADTADEAKAPPDGGPLSTDHYQFSPDLIHARARSLDYYPTGRFKSYGEYFYDMLYRAVRATAARVVIIDDLSCYLNGRPGRVAELAGLFRALHELKHRYQLSILVLAHTRRVRRRPLTLDDIENSRLIGHFADSIFAVGGSCADACLRYLKTVKQGSVEGGFDEMNVPVFRIGKANGNFLSFSFVSFGIERDLLQSARDVVFETELMERILALTAEGRTQRDIAASLGISKTTVNRYLQIDARLAALEIEEMLEKQRSLARNAQREALFHEFVERPGRPAAATANAETADTAVKPGSAQASSAAERFYDSDDEKCDCIECLAGRPRGCLEKYSCDA
jgi:hypothetical protein